MQIVRFSFTFLFFEKIAFLLKNKIGHSSRSSSIQSSKTTEEVSGKSKRQTDKKKRKTEKKDKTEEKSQKEKKR